MAKSVTFRIEEETLALIDHFAAAADRDRSYVLNEGYRPDSCENML